MAEKKVDLGIDVKVNTPNVEKMVKEVTDSLNKTQGGIFGAVFRVDKNKIKKEFQTVEKILVEESDKMILKASKGKLKANFRKQIGVDSAGKAVKGYLALKEKGATTVSNFKKFLSGGGIDNSSRMKRLQDSIVMNERQYAKTTDEKYLTAAKKNKASMAGLSAATGAANIASKAIAAIGKGVSESFEKVVGFSLSIKDNFSNIATMAGSLLQTATQASTGTSLISNSKMRQQQYSLGLSDTENYAYTQASSILGISSMEDLMYMNSQQKTIFANLMNKYSSWYEEMRSNGSLASMQQMQLEFSMFRQELAMKMLNWFSNNKETVYNVINMGVIVLKALFDAVSAIARVFNSNWMPTSSFLSDTVGTSSTTNITINAATTGDGNLQSQLSDWGNQISKQIALSIKG